MIERKRRPTKKITQQPNQSPNRPVQKATLRTPTRRAVCAPEDALGCASVDGPFACRGARRSARRKTRGSARRETRRSARRETRRSARRETRRSARRDTRRSARRETRRSARRKTRRSARRKTRVLHVGRRAGTRRVHAGCAQRARARGAGRSGLSLLAQVSQSSAVVPRAGGGTPGVAPRCAGRPPHT